MSTPTLLGSTNGKLTQYGTGPNLIKPSPLAIANKGRMMLLHERPGSCNRTMPTNLFLAIRSCGCSQLSFGQQHSTTIGLFPFFAICNVLTGAIVAFLVSLFLLPTSYALNCQDLLVYFLLGIFVNKSPLCHKYGNNL